MQKGVKVCIFCRMIPFCVNRYHLVIGKTIEKNSQKVREKNEKMKEYVWNRRKNAEKVKKGTINR